jgi:hypothetical protein
MLTLDCLCLVRVFKETPQFHVKYHGGLHFTRTRRQSQVSNVPSTQGAPCDSLSSNSEQFWQIEPAWRRASYTDHRSPHPPFNRTSSGRGGGTINTPLARAPHATEPNTLTAEATPGWWRSVPRADLSYGPVREHMGTASNPGGDRPPTEHPSLSMRDFIGRQHHPQPPSHIAPHELSTRRPSEVYQSTQPPEVGSMMAVDVDVFRLDESSEVPFSNHAAALFASRAPPSTIESASHRHSDAIDLNRINESSYFPWASRFEEDFAASAPRRRANAGVRRLHASPELERSNTTRRPTATELPTASAPISRILDIEEFQPGPFRATLERFERQDRQDQQMMMERRAEIDRLRSRLFELQSQERPVPSSRVPTLAPLRFDPELLVPGVPHRQPSPTPPANIETASVRCLYTMPQTHLIPP